MITGDPRVFANRTYLNLRYPRPIYDMPTAAHARAAFLSNVSYVRLNEGFDDAAFNTFRAEYDAWLAEGSDAGYGYYIMEPQFEQDDADVVWRAAPR